MTWNVNQKSRRRWKRLASVHEAGHALIAAHFRIPFEYVSGLLQHTQFPAPYLALQDIARESDARDFMRHYAVMLCASRAAVDEILPGQGKEFHYRSGDNTEGDEIDVEEIASELGVQRSDFPSWREGILCEARRLVAQSDIRAAIVFVARELNKLLPGKMTEKEVEAKLKSASLLRKKPKQQQQEENNADI
jgi:hypothetical protein